MHGLSKRHLLQTRVLVIATVHVAFLTTKLAYIEMVIKIRHFV